MVLRVEVDLARLEERVRGSQEALFRIYWQHGDRFYPCYEWLDFGLVILGWWTRELDSVLGAHGSCRGKLTFMDGPYSINLRKPDKTSKIIMAPVGESFTWCVEKLDLIKCIRDASDQVIQELSRKGLYLDQCRSLASSVRNLHTLNSGDRTEMS